MADVPTFTFGLLAPGEGAPAAAAAEASDDGGGGAAAEPEIEVRMHCTALGWTSLQKIESFWMYIASHRFHIQSKWMQSTLRLACVLSHA